MESSIISSSASLLDLLKNITGILVTVLAFVSALASTRSSQILRDRMNDSAGIKRRFNDEKLQKHAELEDDVHTFNMRYRLGVETPTAMHKILAWAQKYRVRLVDLRKTRPYFCPNTLQFNIPTESVSKWAWLWPVMLGILLLLALACLANPYALIKVKKTGTQMWARPAEAYSVNSPVEGMLGFERAWKVSNGTCLLVTADYPLGDPWDKKVTCDLISGRRDEYLLSATAAQRQGGLAMLIALTIPVVPFVLERRRKNAARRLKRLVDGSR